MIKKLPPPEQLMHEASSVFRLRAILWIVQMHPELDYDDIHAKFGETYKTKISKESVVRSLKVLADRGEIEAYVPETDGRRRVWTVVA